MILKRVANGLAIAASQEGSESARQLDLSHSCVLRTDERGHFSVACEPWGILVMFVLDVSIACLMCTTDASGVARLAVRSNGS